MRSLFFLLTPLLLLSPLNAKDEQSIVRFGKNSTVDEGTRVDNAVVIGATLTVNGTVANDAVAVGGALVLGPRASVGHDAVAVGGPIIRDKGAAVAGDIVEIDAPGLSSFASSAARADWGKFLFVVSLFAVIGFLALALLVVALFPGPVGSLTAFLEQRPGASALWAVLGTVLIVPLAVLLAVSIVGIVLIPFELLFVVAAALFGYIAVGNFIGTRLFAAFGRAGTSLLLRTMSGVALLLLAGFVPLLGWLVKVIAVFMGFGASLAYLVAKGKERRSA